MKQTYFFIDDVIWVMRDIARQRPKSIFDNAFMKMLKKAHDEYGMKVQLNLFYRTDFFYGNDEFTLSDMPADYKGEFESASDWLKLAFHAKQEFPDYPYINATYEDVRDGYAVLVNEIKRFAGEASLSEAFCLHWASISKAGCQALVDSGVKFITATYGETSEFDGDISRLPYGHSERLMQNRQPETKLYTRNSRDLKIRSSVCSYNHVTEEQFQALRLKNVSMTDSETGMGYKNMSSITLNLCTPEIIEQELANYNGSEYIGIATHEQYFYPDYYAYQPDYADKVYLAARILHENGYTYINGDEMK